jgi:methyl-accepting chemotaxis protein
MSTLNDLTRDADDLSREASRGNLGVRGDAGKYEGRYYQLIDGINRIIDAMAKPLSDSIGVLNTLAQNDFTARMGDGYLGAFAQLSQSINGMARTINDTLADIDTAADQVESGTQQVSAGNQTLSQGTMEQAGAIEQLTASVTEVADQTRHNASSAGQASNLARAARDSATNGNLQMKDLQKAMDEINESSAGITNIIRVIDDIAFQINLLALNAAVEAARAGQHGKGFAVVAEEVRNLAQRSTNAAQEIEEMIGDSTRKVASGAQLTRSTAEALDHIVGDAGHMAALIGEIAQASSSQATALAQINKGIEQVADVTRTNSAVAEESAAASEELSGQAATLKELVGRFILHKERR